MKAESRLSVLLLMLLNLLPVLLLPPAVLPLLTGLLIPDLETGKILFQGRSDNGLYPFPVSSSSKLSNGVSAFLGVKACCF
ncbi:unnamed protein product [Prunus brigantina]